MPRAQWASYAVFVHIRVMVAPVTTHHGNRLRTLELILLARVGIDIDALDRIGRRLQGLTL